MGNSMKNYIGRVSMIVTAAAAIAGGAAALSATSLVANPADMHWQTVTDQTVADAACPEDMHWSVDLGLCISLAPGDMHW